MEWTVGWWQISVQRVYPTTTELSQTYNQAANWWHQHLHLLGYNHAYRELWRSLKNTNLLPYSKDSLTIIRPGAPLILVATCSGLTGWLIQWHWGNRCFNRKELLSLMHEAGLIRLQFMPFPIGLARLTSFACIGFRRDACF
jgi:hypothetical protein